MFTYKGLSILFDSRVYEPAEDTFLLADAIEKLKLPKTADALEIGIGTGILSLLLAKRCNSVVGIDVNQHAVNLAKKNAELNNIKNARFFESDLFEFVRGEFDLIIFNTPYLPTEGAKEDPAWDGGTTGRKVIDRFLTTVAPYLTEKGKILMVESSLSHYQKTIDMLERQGFKASIVATEKLDFEEIVCIEARRAL